MIFFSGDGDLFEYQDNYQDNVKAYATAYNFIDI